jgi:chromatin remodeling complex protein RSC6
MASSSEWYDLPATITLDESATINDGQSIIQMLDKIQINNKENETYFRQVKRELARLTKMFENKKPRAPSKPMILSDALCEFIGEPIGTQMNWSDVSKRINAYVLQNDLRMPSNKKNILPDEKLAGILKVDDEVQLTYFNMRKFIKHNFTSIPKEIVA